MPGTQKRMRIYPHGVYYVHPSDTSHPNPRPIMKTIESKTYHAHGMTCEHCRIAVTTAIARLEGVDSVDVDLETGRVRIVGTDLNDEAVAAAVADQGYEVTS